MRILGIDPGSQCTGFGIIEQIKGRQIYIVSGCIRIAKLPVSQRLYKIFESVNEIINNYAPTAIAIEKIFVHKNVSSALKLGQARGAALVACAKHGIEVAEYTPRQIKKSIVGYGHADKKQVQEMTRILLKLNDIPPSDAADALAVAIYHANLNGSMLGLMNKAQLIASR